MKELTPLDGVGIELEIISPPLDGIKNSLLLDSIAIELEMITAS